MVSKRLVIDIGGTKIRSSLWDGRSLSDIHEMPTPSVDSKTFLETLLDFIKPQITKTSVGSIGIASAGPINVETGHILNAANLGNGDPSWLDFNPKQYLEQSLGLPVLIDNDAALSALGYHRLVVHQAFKDLVVITLGTGVGLGAIVNNDLVRAGQGLHPEFGHTLIAEEGAAFSAESLLSGRYFTERVNKALGTSHTGKTLVMASQQSDLLKPHWQTYSRHMALFLANVYFAYFPLEIVLAGGFAQSAAPFFFDSATSQFQKTIAPRLAPGIVAPKVSLAEQANQLPLLGAAVL